MWKVAPLKSSFMLASILGFLITLIYTDRIGNDWAFTLGFVFALMFVASMISMRNAPIDEQLELDKTVNPPKKVKKK
jgi:multisubunit Na+/H+ antiporter MnhB subunit